MSGRRSRDRFIRLSLEIVLPFTKGGKDLYRRILGASGPACGGLDDVGLLRALDVPLAAAIAVTVAAQDLRAYLYHRLLHRSPALWRAHRIPHVDMPATAERLWSAIEEARLMHRM